ncbi:MAG: SGNH/GDSL hydrolase family protein [Pseudomonadota bacterium]
MMYNHPSFPDQTGTTTSQLSFTRRLTYLVVSILIGLTVTLLLLETASYFLLKMEGKAQPFLWRPYEETILGRDQFREAYRTLDPHLAFTYGKNSPKLAAVRQKYTWMEGFVVYGDMSKGLQRPIILALGGSTTDGVKFPNSWPEQLARLLKERNLPGTVINGGIGGYTSSQELLKLIRDGLEFQPNIVITLNGVNDALNYGLPGHLMVQPYQENVMQVATGAEDGRWFPNTVTLFRRAFPKSTDIDYTLGLTSNRPRASLYRKNVELMNASCLSQGCRFYDVIQPFSFFNSRHARPNPESVGTEYIRAVTTLYQAILPFKQRHDYIRDATQVLEGTDQAVYQNDGVHLTDEGNRIIAEYMLEMIKDHLQAQ